jgi:hypothetical protein
MLAPELYVLAGVVLVLVSILLIGVAQYVRGWFFLPDLRSDLQSISTHESRHR